jgi:predicted ATPase/class 3 adenylate cyclase
MQGQAAPDQTRCRWCGASSGTTALFCSRCGAPLGDDAVQGAGELRQISVVFCDLVASSALSEQLGPEDLRDMIAECHRRWSQVVSRWDGYAAQYLGDGCLIYFGFPEAHEDDARRAVGAGLDLVSAVAESSATHALHARVGVYTGQVMIGKLAGGGRHEMLAVGEAVHRAARVQAAARVDSVAIGVTTADLVRGFFDLRETGIQSLRGFSAPSAVFEVVRETRARDRLDVAPDQLTPFVEGGAGVRDLLALWEETKGGAAPLALFVGEAGLGKSRHVQVFRERVAATNPIILSAHCSPYHQGTVLHPLVQVLEAELRLDAQATPAERLAALRASLAGSDAPAETLPLLAALLSIPPEAGYEMPPLSPQRLHAATQNAVLAWLAARARTSPTLLVIEDLHWADPTTLALLATALKQPPIPRLLTVATARPDLRRTAEETLAAFAASPRCKEIVLPRLSLESVKALVAAMTKGRALPPGLIDHIVERADGVPLFVEEITNALLRTLPTSGEAGGAAPRGGEIPLKLQDLLTARLDRLGSDRPLAQLAAVLGREFRVDVLCAASSREPAAVDAALETLERTGLAFPTSHANRTYAFRHALIREAAYTSLPKPARRELHDRVARALLTTSPGLAETEPELLASHYAAAEQFDKAARYYGSAGRTALNRSAYAEATAMFGKALRETERMPRSRERDHEEVALWSGLGLSHLSTKGFSAKEVEDAYRRGLELSERVEDTPLRILYGIYAFHTVRGDLAETGRLSRMFARMVGTAGDDGAKLVLNAAIGSRAFFRGELSAARAPLGAATALCDREALGRQNLTLLRDYGWEGLLYGPLFNAWCDLFEGRVAAARAAVDEWVGLAARSGHPYLHASALGLAAPIMHDMTDLAAAGAMAGQMLEIGVQNDFHYWIATALCVAGWVRCRMGDADGAGMMEQGLVMFRAIGSLLVYPYFLTYLIEAHLAAGRIEEGLRRADEALQIATEGLNISFVSEMRRLKGHLLLAAGSASAAEDCFRVALATTRESGANLLALRAATSLAHLLAGRGARAEAREILRAARRALPEASTLPEVLAAAELEESLAGA